MSAAETVVSSLMRSITRLLAPLTGMRWSYAIALLLACAAMLVTALQSYRAIDRELTDVTLSRRAAVAQLAATTLSEKLERLVDIAVSLATRVRFRQLVAEGEWLEAIKILRDVPRDFPFTDRLVLFDTAGTVMADIPEQLEVRGKNFAYRDWYQGVSRDWKPYVSTVYRRAAAPQSNVFAVAVPIRRESGGEVAGILLLQTRLDTYFEWVRDADVGPGGFVYVVDHKGQVAFHPKFPAQGTIVELTGVPVVQRVLRGDRGIEIAFEATEKEDAISAYAPVAKYGWGVIVRQPKRAAFAAKDQQIERLLTAYGLTFLFFVLGIYLASWNIVQRRQADEDRRMKAELERHVAERTAQLEAANKELESFSYSVSHDLRSPLRAIDGFSRILQEDHNDKLSDEGRRLLGVIRDSSQKMGQLIDDLLAFSRLGRQSLSTAEIDMKRMVEEVLKEVHVAGERRSKLVLKALPPARGDATLLRQVWSNLLDNAIKFSGKRERPVIEVSGHENGVECVYCVKDNGVGFDMQYYDKLFGVFQRLHSAEEFAGTGVGLAIVQRVITRHGGRVWAEGKVGEGAAFHFSLPKERHDGQV